jgi:hypothetical protein
LSEQTDMQFTSLLPSPAAMRVAGGAPSMALLLGGAWTRSQLPLTAQLVSLRRFSDSGERSGVSRLWK